MKKLLLLLAAGLWLSSCTTLGGEHHEGAVSIDRFWLNKVRQKIEREEIFSAFQDISLLERESSPDIPADQVTSLKEEIVSKIAAGFAEHVRKGEYEQAYRYYGSLQGIGREDLAPDWSAGKLLFSLAQSQLEQGALPQAFLSSLAALAGEQPQPEWQLFALRMAEEMGNAPIAQQLADRLSERGVALPEELRQKLPAVPAVERIVRGTVTVWVDRGIKVEKGVGYPDRVIGSGFFIDKRGYILTNHHVISSEVDPKYEGYSRLYIRLSEKSVEKIPARVVGYDRIFDLALLKTEVTPEFILSAGTDPPLKPGDAVIAVGSPAGLENTVTSGIVSALGRRFLQMGDAIQVDVPVNPGNSGGPLLDAKGQLVGVIFAGIEQFQGINFAIPFSWVNRVLPRLYHGGEVSHSWLGMALHEGEGGLEVIYVVPGEPAATARIRRGDVIKSLNGTPMKTLRDIQGAILQFDHPSLVRLGWNREGRTLEGALALAARPFSPIEVGLNRDARDDLIFPLFGMRLEKIGSTFLKPDYLVKQVLQGSIADETGLSADDPLSIQGWQVDKKNRFAVLQLFVKKKKSGFLESVIQLAAYLETDNFI